MTAGLISSAGTAFAGRLACPEMLSAAGLPPRAFADAVAGNFLGNQQDTFLADEASISRLVASAGAAPGKVQLNAARPRLTPPAAGAVEKALGLSRPQSADAMLVLLTGRLREVISNANSEELLERVTRMSQEYRARMNDAIAAAGSYETLQLEHAALTRSVEAAQADVNTAQSEVAAAEKKVSEIEKQMQLAATPDPKLSKISEGSTEAANAGSRSVMDELRRQQATALEQLSHARSVLQQYSAAFVNVANAAIAKSDKLRALEATVASAVPPARLPDANRAAARKAEALILWLDQILAASGESSMKDEMELVRAQMRAQTDRLQKSAAEYTKKLEEQEALTRTLGLLGKIIAGILVAVGFIGALFTGGASLVIASVALALFTAEMASGVSVLGKVFEPIATHIIGPLTELIAKSIEKSLIKAGVSEETARLVGAIIGAAAAAVIAVAAVVVAVFVSKSAATKIMEKLGTKIADMLSKNTSRFVELAQQIGAKGQSLASTVRSAAPGNVFSRLARSPDAMRLASLTTSGAAWAQLAATVSLGIGEVIAAEKGVAASKKMSEMEVNRQSQDIFSAIMDDILRNLSTFNDALVDRRGTAIELQQSQLDTARYIASKIAQRRA